jgi:hypothetical protein
MIGFNHNHRFIRSLLLVFEAVLFEHLVVDDPVVVKNAAVLALLAGQQSE